MRARAECGDRERRRAISLAWHQAALTGAAWAGKLPKLEELLEPSKAPAAPDRRTPEEMDRVFSELQALAVEWNSERR